jgi:hypothetical protein
MLREGDTIIVSCPKNEVYILTEKLTLIDYKRLLIDYKSYIRKITSSLRAPTVDPGYPGAVRKLRASGHPGVPPGTGSFF